MSTKRKILIVDDNEDNRTLLKMYFSSEGHDVELAGNGREALEKLARFMPQFAFIDIGLPDIDGYEVAKQYFDGSPVEPAQLFAVTGFGDPEDIRRSKAAGFKVHFLKPLDLDKLRKAIE